MIAWARRQILYLSLLLSVWGTLGAGESAMGPLPSPLLLQSESDYQLIDGIEAEWLTLSSQDFRARWFPGGGWLLRSNREGASLTFAQRVNSNLQMRLYLYPRSSVLTDLSDESLRAYAASIPAQHPGWKLADRDIHVESPPIGGLLLMDAAYRKLSYVLVPENTAGEERYVCDLVSILEDGRLFVMRFLGTEQFVRLTERDVSSELGRFIVEM